MNICSYGCGQEAIHQFQNGKWCCNELYQRCPAVTEKNSISNKKYCIINGNIRKNYRNPNKIMTSCEFCNKEISVASIKRHKKYCYLNPDNLRFCPVCNEPIKNYRQNTTCSTKCSNIFFREEVEKYRNKGNNVSKRELEYRIICFTYHEKKCVICNEEIALHVHHLDENGKNNSPENLIPLCANHHFYAQCKYKILIEKRIENYVLNFELWLNSFNLYLE